MRLVNEACQSGARFEPACQIVGLDPRTVQRWKLRKNQCDMRMGPKTKPANALTSAEEKEALRVMNLPEYRELSPKQIVPRLADKGVYIASESTMERLLRRENQNKHRGPKKPKTHTKPREKKATGPCQIWSWDITYLRTEVMGRFYYLYMAIDVWSRKIVAHQVFVRECSKLAAEWITKAMAVENVTPAALTVHQDNGSPMKGTLKASLENLGVLMSYSRPHVSDDNPYSESLFGTMKTRPEYPTKPFESLQAAQKWCDHFVRWYNESHLHSAIGFVTPLQRHEAKSEDILEKRRELYEKARCKKPERWAKETRRWEQPKIVYLNPDKHTLQMIRNK